ncbi:MAG: hypothetical protein E7446_04640 [Ruminococcaceae bacterium]|nr:hypothetical protein [Oscillospiraceae bacterium]
MKQRENYQQALSYRKSIAVTALLRFPTGDIYPLCPRCASTLDREYMRFCDRCGQRLSWHQLKHCTIQQIKP